MRIPTRRRRYGLRFDLTPLNDIVFLLIIFLVASPHFAPSEAKEDVDLPDVPAEERKKPQTDRRVEVTVRDNGDYRIGNETVTPDELRQRIAAAAKKTGEGAGPYEMRIRADRRTKFSAIEPILIACARAKITDVKFAVMPE